MLFNIFNAFNVFNGLVPTYGNRWGNRIRPLPQPCTWSAIQKDFSSVVDTAEGVVFKQRQFCRFENAWTTFLSPILIIIRYVVHYTYTMICILTIFLMQLVCPKTAKNCRNLNSKIGLPIFVFEQKILIFF